ncbi:MAG TPA: hypothetical protein VGN00_13440 [Puia sp.]|jgi:hypothetical protein
MKKFLWISGIIIVAVLVLFFCFRYYWPFGDGVKAGELNYVVRKGYIFKTYEGKLIQTGIRSKTPGTVQSYEFEFSISNEAVAKKLEVNSGKTVLLHYIEYKGALPWRGYSEFVVDSIVSITDPVK